MAKLIGSVDHLGRPIVRVAVVGRDDDMLATVDTGFNGEIMMTAGDADVLGIGITEEAEDVTLGHGHSVDVRLARLRLRWLDVEREVTAFVSDNTTPTPVEPMVLVGTRLLTPHLLLLDFAAGTVEIETQD